MLNVHHLKYFYDSCLTENMSEAARLNRVSHSAVSQAIRSLESTLDVKLIRHAKKHFELTPEGHRLFDKAQGLFEQIEGLAAIGQTGDEKLRGPLKIGLSHSIGLGLTTPPLAAFLKSHPDVAPSLSIGNSGALERLLQTREIEIGFGIEDGSFASFDRQKIYEGKFMLVAKKGVEKSSRFILGDKGAEVRRALTEIKERKLKAEIMSVQSWTITADMAARGLGIGLIPDFLLNGSAAKLIQVHANFKLPDYQLFAFYRSEGTLSRNARAFLQAF